ncbi:MAG TPA: glycosyl hydrolase 115 family protein [Longimicrobiales bacterium]|nr:glycosyl hydrolase 115 family protein [Longimicrobiales bacterium]
MTHRTLALLATGTALLAAAAAPRAAAAQGVPGLPDGGAAYVAARDGPGRFPLAVAGRPAALWVDSADHAGVIRAVGELRADVARVTGAEPALEVGGAPAAGPVVLVGTLGRSALVDRLVREKKLDMGDVAGRWETFVVQAVRRPLPGVEEALVVAGSDKRGTIYGVYDLSAQIGVSPWYWWADVPVRRQASLFVLPGRHTQGEPAVRYRGIFLNDEAPALSGWAREKFGGFDHRFYEKVFELILRLKGNYLWPAMWGSAFADDDTASPRLADEYGIVMGTSHHEPMTRAQAEWHRYGAGPWNYEQNDSTLRRFWRQGIERMGSRENIVTIGMRGDGDMPMTEGSNIALLERIVADQRRIIADVTGKPASETPQLWALYKEVQDYYDKGMRVPDDVTLLFSDDNWGNLRRLPAAKDRARRGGFGIYYHFDYVGGPRNYKWINTNPIARVWEQMNLAYRYGADRIWIVNVGDLKPMELPISFFLDFAWAPDRWPAERLPEYTRRWAAQQFGAAHAAEIAELLTAYTKLNGRRKPELLAPETYSLTSYDEAETVVAEWKTLEAKAERLSRALPAADRDAFYELVQHPIEAGANLNELYVTVALNRRYAREGRAATNELADRARALFERDAAISRKYNEELAGGKWRHMMDQTHIGYTYWQEPPRNVMPRVDVIQVPEAGEMGVAWEGEPEPGPRGPPGAARRTPPALPRFDPYLRQTYHIDVYNRGRTPFEYAARAGAPWLLVTPESGTVEKQTRVSVSVDWARVPPGDQRAPITVSGPGGRSVVIQAIVANPAAPKRDDVVGFVESDGYVSMEAEHYTRAVGGGGVHWQRIPDLGRTLSGMTPFPVTASPRSAGGESPRLEYRVYLFDAGDVSVSAYLSPTLDFTGSAAGLGYAVSFDDEPPQLVRLGPDTSNAAWEKAVSDNIRVMITHHRIASTGAHVLKFWMVDPGVVLQKLVIDAGGVRPSYLGPPESFHGNGNDSPQRRRARRATAEAGGEPHSPASASN